MSDSYRQEQSESADVGDSALQQSFRSVGSSYSSFNSTNSEFGSALVFDPFTSENVQNSETATFHVDSAVEDSSVQENVTRPTEVDSSSVVVTIPENPPSPPIGRSSSPTTSQKDSKPDFAPNNTPSKPLTGHNAETSTPNVNPLPEPFITKSDRQLDTSTTLRAESSGAQRQKAEGRYRSTLQDQIAPLAGSASEARISNNDINSKQTPANAAADTRREPQNNARQQKHRYVTAFGPQAPSTDSTQVTHQQTPTVHGAAASHPQQPTRISGPPTASSSNPNSYPVASKHPPTDRENAEMQAIGAAGGVATRGSTQDKPRDSVTSREAMDALERADAEARLKKGRDARSASRKSNTRDSRQSSPPIPIEQRSTQHSSQHRVPPLSFSGTQTSTSQHSTENHAHKFVDPFVDQSLPSPRRESPPSPHTWDRQKIEEVNKQQNRTVIQGAPPPPEWYLPTLPAFIEYDMRMFVNPRPDFESTWNSQHVKFPCSQKNRCYEPSNVNLPLWKWSFIKNQLSKVSNILELEQAIRNYNPTFASSWDPFRNLRNLAREFTWFERGTMQYIIEAAMDMPNSFDRPIPFLRRQKNALVRLSQKQCVCLLANMFLCTFPRRLPHSSKLKNETLDFPSVSFEELFTRQDESCLEKLKCLAVYFEFHRWNPAVNGMVEIRRQVLPGDLIPKWSKCHARFTLCKLEHAILLEEAGGHWQADFANKVIGGGVLGSGAVQEEIRFVISPECIVSRLICQTLDDNEAVLISGSQQYSAYTGYGDKFKFQSALDELAAPAQVIAFDALSYSRHDPMDQFKSKDTLRELTKALAAFLPANEDERAIPIATGRWGCGVFKGNEIWKFVIQWMAAAAAGRQLTFCTPADRKLFDRLFPFVKTVLNTPGLTVVDFYRAMVQWSPGSQDANFLTFLTSRFPQQSPKNDYNMASTSKPPESRYLPQQFNRMTTLPSAHPASQWAPHNHARELNSQQGSLGQLGQHPPENGPQIIQPPPPSAQQQIVQQQYANVPPRSLPPQYRPGQATNQGMPLPPYPRQVLPEASGSQVMTHQLDYPPHNASTSNGVQPPTMALSDNSFMVAANALKLSTTPYGPRQ